LHLPTLAFSRAEKRITLLIGNEDCKTTVGSRSNPFKGIRIVGAALKSPGFEVLKPTQDASAWRCCELPVEGPSTQLVINSQTAKAHGLDVLIDCSPPLTQ